MLPVHLLDPLDGVFGQRVVDGDAGDLAAAQVVDHVVDGLELFLQVVRLERLALRRAHALLHRLLRQAAAGGESNRGRGLITSHNHNTLHLDRAIVYVLWFIARVELVYERV